MGAKILAIEDDPQILDLYVTFFERRGYTVLCAANGRKAIATLEGNRDVKLILLDLNLPGMSGEEWMRWYESSGIRAPIIVVSGKGDILSVARSHPDVAALTKPFHMEELQELVEVLLEENWESEVTDDAQLH
ncbi:MAG: response regulator [Acidobacteria bacterium]|nr:response regulator [Acidobacteriota bacterium]